MQHFFDWFAVRRAADQRPWLILGKGPSFGLRSRFDLSRFNLLSLNHVVREQPVLLAHMIDLDVVDACAEALVDQAGYVVLPWHPHVGNVPSPRSLEELVPSHQVLRRLGDEGRLLWYDLSTAPNRRGPGPVVQATYFSAEAAVNLLALAGVRRVRSLGVDGGAGYSADFEDLRHRTLLANGQPGFDLQFQGIARTIQHTGIDFAPLDHPSPIVVNVLSEPANALPDRVLEYTVVKHTSMTVRMHFSGAAGEGASTLPLAGADAGLELAGERRRAILLRSGALVLDDLRKLWARPLDRDVLEVPRGTQGDGAVSPALGVVTVSHERALEDSAAVFLTMADSPHAEAALAGGIPMTATLPSSWGRQDWFEQGDTSLLLYAAPGLQPWISRAHPLGHLWVAILLEAVHAGFVSTDLVRTEVGLGHVRPSLLEQVERGSLESLLVSWTARRRDARFMPPGGAPARRTGILRDPLLVLQALARHARRGVRAYRLGRAAARA